MSKFAFELNQIVRIIESRESGVIVARAEYTYMDYQYLVRYKAADGRAVEQWWTEGALEAV